MLVMSVSRRASLAFLASSSLAARCHSPSASFRSATATRTAGIIDRYSCRGWSDLESWPTAPLVRRETRTAAFPILRARSAMSRPSRADSPYAPPPLFTASPSSRFASFTHSRPSSPSASENFSSHSSARPALREAIASSCSKRNTRSRSSQKTTSSSETPPVPVPVKAPAATAPSRLKNLPTFPFRAAPGDGAANAFGFANPP
mmetsp:Transcript_6390/g.25913  ORF Transcript_6390/g.25913 Transcript_6390/m.25913 type:complete len:204 (+) Transcript_6390:354-965(+)